MDTNLLRQALAASGETSTSSPAVIISSPENTATPQASSAAFSHNPGPPPPHNNNIFAGAGFPSPFGGSSIATFGGSASSQGNDNGIDGLKTKHASLVQETGRMAGMLPLIMRMQIEKFNSKADTMGPRGAAKLEKIIKGLEDELKEWEPDDVGIGTFNGKIVGFPGMGGGFSGMGGGYSGMGGRYHGYGGFRGYGGQGGFGGYGGYGGGGFGC